MAKYLFSIICPNPFLGNVPILYSHKTSEKRSFSVEFQRVLNGNVDKKWTLREVSKFGVLDGTYFPAFALNTEIYGVNLRIQSKYRKIRTRKNSVFGHFSRSVKLTELWFSFYCSEGYFCLRHMNQLLVFNPFLASDFLSSSLKYQKDLGFLMIKR